MSNLKLCMKSNASLKQGPPVVAQFTWFDIPSHRNKEHDRRQKRVAYTT